MATHLDLEEQEQLDQLKAFWKQYGNLITWALTIVLAGFAAWNGWNWWQREQAVKAAAMFDELQKAADAGDAAKTAGIFNDLKERFGGTAFAQQAACSRRACSSTRARPTPPRPRSTGCRQRRGDRIPQRRPAAPAGLLADQKVRRRRSSSSTARTPRSSRRWWPTAAATSCRQGKTEDARRPTRRPGRDTMDRPSSTAG